MTTIYAHRGVHDAHAENTIAAFLAAERSGADGIETDLRHTRDGIVVLHHDHAVAGVPVSQLSHRELDDLAGHPVTTLSDIASHDWTVAWNLEIKTETAFELARAEIAAWRGEVLVTSFIHEIAVRSARETGRRAGLLLANRPIEGCVPQTLPGVDMLVWDWKVLDRRTAMLARTLGWRYAAYGMSSADEHRMAAEMGLDTIITDHVERAVRNLRPS